MNARSAVLALALVVAGLPAQAQDAGTPSPPASAEASAAAGKIEVSILHATNDGTGIDPKIGKRPELSKPPFSAYDSYKLLDKPTLALAKGQEVSYKLPNGRDMKFLLKDITPPKQKGDPAKYAISASIKKADGKSFLPNVDVNANAGETFFVAGQTHGAGILVIGIKPL